jgi:hypothetical protein
MSRAIRSDGRPIGRIGGTEATGHEAEAQFQEKTQQHQVHPGRLTDDPEVMLRNKLFNDGGPEVSFWEISAKPVSG